MSAKYYVCDVHQRVAFALHVVSVACGFVYVEEQQVSSMCLRCLCSECVACFLYVGGCLFRATGLTDLCPWLTESCLAPSPERQEQELMVTLGQPVQLCCGQAERGGHWYKEGSRLAPAGRVRGWRGRLEIASFLPEDTGHYLCLARGSMLVLHNVTLVVDGKEVWQGLKGTWGETLPVLDLKHFPLSLT